MPSIIENFTPVQLRLAKESCRQCLVEIFGTGSSSFSIFQENVITTVCIIMSPESKPSLPPSYFESLLRVTQKFYLKEGSNHTVSSVGFSMGLHCFNRPLLEGLHFIFTDKFAELITPEYIYVCFGWFHCHLLILKPKLLVCYTSA